MMSSMSIDSRFRCVLRNPREVSDRLLGALYRSRPRTPEEGGVLFRLIDDFFGTRRLRTLDTPDVDTDRARTSDGLAG